MTAPRTQSQIGKSNRRKGQTAERDVVRYLRQHGWPGAERAVRTGYRTATRVSADPGDITGTPGLVWQVKDCRAERVTDWMAETEEQRREAGAHIGLLVVKRHGKSDPGRWWVWLRLDQLGELLAEVEAIPTGFRLSVPVRMELQHVIPLLHSAGYGTPVLT